MLSGMRHSPQQTCQSFDSELWYLGDVLYISGTSKCGQFKQYVPLTVKATTEVVSFLKILKTQCSCCGLD